MIAICEEEGIEADIVRSGVVHVARSPAQLTRMRENPPEAPVRLLTGPEMAERIDVAGALGGYVDPDCARVQPARLVRGLAGVVRRLGVTSTSRPG